MVLIKVLDRVISHLVCWRDDGREERKGRQRGVDLEGGMKRVRKTKKTENKEGEGGEEDGGER